MIYDNLVSIPIYVLGKVFFCVGIVDVAEADSLLNDLSVASAAS